jgi:hypothetical protein
MLNSAHRDDWPVLSHGADFIQWNDDVAGTYTHKHRWGGGNLEFKTLRSTIRKVLQTLAQ